MNKQKTKLIYGVFPYNRENMAMAPRTIEELFPSRDSIRANVLLYTHGDPSDDRNQDRYLAYALSESDHFNVGITTNTDADLARLANIVLTGSNIPEDHEFYIKLKEYDDGSRLILNAKEREYFRGKNLREVVKSIGTRYHALGA